MPKNFWFIGVLLVALLASGIGFVYTYNTGGFTFGIADLVGGHDVKGFRVCFPENVDLKLIVTTTEEYLADHPERLQYTADKLVLDALADAFPCAR